MNDSVQMNRETALRIALAARALPGLGVGEVLEILHQRIDGVIDEASLQTVTVNDLKAGIAGPDVDEVPEDVGIPMTAMKEAVRILWGETLDASLPQPVASAEQAPGSIRVAVASNNGHQLDGHFGSCLRFLVYQVSAETLALLDVRSTVDAELAEDKNAWRAELIGDCQVLYVVSIGGPAAAKVVRAGVHPVKKAGGGDAEAVLAELQQVMAGNPPPWLAKLMGQAAEQRVRFERSDEEALSA